MYQFIKEDTDPTEEKLLGITAMMIENMLPAEDQKIIMTEWEEYRDSNHAAGKAMKPFYRWILDRIEIKLK